MESLSVERKMTDAEYFAAPGLSQSALKDLAVSPLRFWHLHLNPEAPEEEPTPYMIFGSAVGCAVLEGPEAFMNRYACAISPEDYPGLLITMEDLRGWLRSKGATPKGTRKEDVITQCLAVDPSVPILEVLERRNRAQNEGKTFLSKEDWNRVGHATDALMDEPRIAAILKQGEPEVPMFAKCPETGVTMKSKMDWVTKGSILEIKTFSQKRGKSIDKSVADAIYYERYLWQGVWYTKVRGLTQPHWYGDYVMAFVESEPPHEVRLKVVRPKERQNLYWTVASMEVRQLVKLYADCLAHFGTDPWRYAQEVEALTDQDFPQVAFGG